VLGQHKRISEFELVCSKPTIIYILYLVVLMFFCRQGNLTPLHSFAAMSVAGVM